MNRILCLLAILVVSYFSSNAQITLAHTFPKPIYSQSKVVNVGPSGKKIMTVLQKATMGAADTLYFYNLDYSLWKTIPCPGIPNYTGAFNIFENVGYGPGIFYPSENLFNLDPLLEVAVSYLTGGTSTQKILIINETGTIVDSIINVARSFPGQFNLFKIDTLGIGFQVHVISQTGVSVYNLPGTLPCDACANSFGVAIQEKSKIDTQPFPNPSGDKVKITFTLPNGAKEGELTLYSVEGKKVKSYKVDDRFGFIMLDNSELKTGVYYYNIIVDGVVSSTQKMVVLK
jgi:hypothetical protein